MEYVLARQTYSTESPGTVAVWSRAVAADEGKREGRVGSWPALEFLLFSKGAYLSAAFDWSPE